MVALILCLKHEIAFYHAGRYHKSSTLSVNGQDSLLSEVSYTIYYGISNAPRNTLSILYINFML